jgi:hypothetical protein
MTDHTDLLARADYWLEHYEPRVYGDDIDADLITDLATALRPYSASLHRPGYNCGSVQCAGCYPHHFDVGAATDEAVLLMDDFDAAWCRDGALYGKTYWRRMLEAIPTEVLTRVVEERKATVL